VVHLLNCPVKLIEICDIVDAIPLKVGVFEKGLLMAVDELVHVAYETGSVNVPREIGWC
jgi:hypothetical protein